MIQSLQFYITIGDFLQAERIEDPQNVTVYNSEILTTAIVAAKFFGNNFTLTLSYMRTNFVPKMISSFPKSSLGMNLFAKLRFAQNRVFNVSVFPNRVWEQEKIFDRHEMSLFSRSKIYADKAYNSMVLERDLFRNYDVDLLPIRKNNYKVEIEEQAEALKYKRRKRIETTFSEIQFRFPKFLHCVNSMD